MINKIKQSPLLLSVLSGLLLAAGWTPSPLFFLLFVAWIPLLQIAKIGIENNKKTVWFWKWALLTVFIWNLGTTWWVWFASEGGAIAMLIANSLLMSLVLAAFYFTRKYLPKSGYASFIAYWIAFELLHYNWDIDFPWLTLGNGLAKFPVLIQWYEYTGVLGGSFWILAVNVTLFVLAGKKIRKPVFPILLLLLPVFISLTTFWTYKTPQDSKEIEVLIVQPNLDPYEEKFKTDPYSITEEMVKDIEANISPDTRFAILPETAIPKYFELSEWKNEDKIRLLYGLTNKHPNLALVAGVETYKAYYLRNGNCQKPTPTARSTDDSCFYYDVYNTAAFIYQNREPVYYHKSKLVLGVEKMPYPDYLGFLEKLSINLDGTSGSLGRSEKPILFYGADSIATCGLICYESIFGGFVKQFAAQGANFLTIITNDGWWGNTPGYKQHLYYGTIRAIETRKYIARSANTGISAIIDDKGVIRQQTSWWEKAILKGNIKTNSTQTFYTRNGDLLGQACKFVSIFLLLGSVVKRKTKDT